VLFLHPLSNASILVLKSKTKKMKGKLDECSHTSLSLWLHHLSIWWFTAGPLQHIAQQFYFIAIAEYHHQANDRMLMNWLAAVHQTMDWWKLIRMVEYYTSRRSPKELNCRRWYGCLFFDHSWFKKLSCRSEALSWCWTFKHDIGGLGTASGHYSVRLVSRGGSDEALHCIHGYLRLQKRCPP
jgi:hypothetical protein